MVEDLETKKHLIRCSLKKDGEDTEQIIDIEIPDEQVKSFYNAEVSFDIIRRVTLVEERSLSEIKDKKE